MPKDIFKRAADLHRQIHRNDPPPDNERERQAEFVLSRMKQTIMDLIMKEVTPHVLDLSLFYTWLRLAVLHRGYGEEIVGYWSSRMDLVMKPLITLLKKTAAEIEDEGPSESMKEMGGIIEQMKEMVGGPTRESLRQEEIVRQVDMTNRALFGQVQECFDREIHPALIESTCFYYWLRISTVNANISEELFQKFERNWPEIWEKVDMFVTRLLTRPIT